MSKIVAITILSALTLLPMQEAPKPARDVPAAHEMEVMVLFAGLMVFNKLRSGSYEVGILGGHHSGGHDFCIQQLGASRVCREKDQKNKAKKEDDYTYLPDGKNWVFSIDNANPPNESPVGMHVKEKRRPDVEGEQFDFSWIIDLDGEFFHGKRLELKDNQFQPIIQLPRVQLFTKYKSPDFVRWQGTKPRPPQPPAPAFGFAAECVGFRVFLKRGEALTLKQVNDDNTQKVITKIPYVPPSPVGGNYEVLYIYNTRYPQHEASDFKMYYRLFKPRQVQAREQYDFAENETHPCESPGQPPCKPLNPAPKKIKPTADKATKKKIDPDEIRTCCDLVCTPIRLVNYGDRLP